MLFYRATKSKLRGKRALIRLDLNVPLADGEITSTARIDAALPIINLAIDSGAKVLLMSHMGRPKEGQTDPALSLAPVLRYLSRALSQKSEVTFCTDYLKREPQLESGEVALLENTRFNIGEKKNDLKLAEQYAALCDVFVMDAFGAAHRAQASTEGVAHIAKEVYAGPLLDAETKALNKVFDMQCNPLLAIIGGAKVSTKLNILKNLAPWVDHLILGGGIANTFLAAAGHNIGKSLHEPDLIPTARNLIATAKRTGKLIPLPQDAIVAKSLSADAPSTVKSVDKLANDDMILDLGPATAHEFAARIAKAKTVLWNGPVGAFEFPQFASGTETLGRAVARSSAFSVAGGGDTIAAAELFHLTDKLSFVSTGGGAFLEFMEGKDLPALAILKKRGIKPALQQVGKKQFVANFELFKSGDQAHITKTLLRDGISTSISGCSGRLRGAKFIFRNRLEKAALQEVTNSTSARVTEDTKMRAKELLREIE